MKGKDRTTSSRLVASHTYCIVPIVLQFTRYQSCHTVLKVTQVRKRREACRGARCARNVDCCGAAESEDARRARVGTARERCPGLEEVLRVLELRPSVCPLHALGRPDDLDALCPLCMCVVWRTPSACACARACAECAFLTLSSTRLKHGSPRMLRTSRRGLLRLCLGSRVRR